MAEVTVGAQRGGPSTSPRTAVAAPEAGAVSDRRACGPSVSHGARTLPSCRIARQHFFSQEATFSPSVRAGHKAPAPAAQAYAAQCPSQMTVTAQPGGTPQRKKASVPTRLREEGLAPREASPGLSLRSPAPRAICAMLHVSFVATTRREGPAPTGGHGWGRQRRREGAGQSRRMRAEVAPRLHGLVSSWGCITQESTCPHRSPNGAPPS